MRLIDADALQRRICGAKCGCEYEDCGNEGDCGYDYFIFTAPTIDAVPVVRCRECKHLNVVNRKELYAHCPKTNTVFLPFELDTREHFCSLGERKEGADNG